MKKKRPFFLVLLTILSMCGATLGILISVFSIFDVEYVKLFSRIPGYTSIYSLSARASFLYPFVKLIIYLVSFFGAFLMFNLCRNGFYFYIFAQLSLLIIPYFMWNSEPIVVFLTDLPDVIFTVAFIGAYALYLSDMKGNCRFKRNKLVDLNNE